MPKSIEEIKKALAGLEGGQDYVDGVDAALDAKGIEASRIANKEAKGLRERLKPAEKALAKLAEIHGVDFSGEDLDEKLSEVEKKIKAPGNAGKDGGNPELNSRLKKLEDELKASQERENKTRERSETNLKKSVLANLLGKAGVDPLLVDDYVKQLSLDVKVVDGEKVYATQGDEDVTAEDFVSAFVKARPSIVKNQSQPGAGNKSQGGESGAPKQAPGNTSGLSSVELIAQGFAAKK